MSRTLAALILAALIPLSAQAGEHRTAVMDLLNAIEQPANKADLEALGEGVVKELLEIAADEEVPVSRRGRAVSALQFFPTDEVKAFLVAKAASGEKSLYRRKAVGALGAGWGEASLETITPYLADEDEQLRMATARALGSIGGEAAKAALEGRLKVETADAVKEVLDASIKEVAK